MCTNFGGRGLSSFGDIDTFKQPIFPFGPWTIIHGSEKIELNRISSKNSWKYSLWRCTCAQSKLLKSFLVLLLVS